MRCVCVTRRAGRACGALCTAPPPPFRPQVTFSGRPGEQGTTLDVAGRRGLLQLPESFEGPFVRLHDLQLVNLPYDAAPRDCRAFFQAQMHWIRMPERVAR